jgi:hypothetical protein
MAAGFGYLIIEVALIEKKVCKAALAAGGSGYWY